MSEYAGKVTVGVLSPKETGFKDDAGKSVKGYKVGSSPVWGMFGIQGGPLSKNKIHPGAGAAKSASSTSSSISSGGAKYGAVNPNRGRGSRARISHKYGSDGTMNQCFPLICQQRSKYVKEG